MIKLRLLLLENKLKVGDFALTTGRGPMTGPNSPVAIANLLVKIVGIRRGKYLVKFRGSNNPLEAMPDQLLKTYDPSNRF